MWQEGRLQSEANNLQQKHDPELIKEVLRPGVLQEVGQVLAYGGPVACCRRQPRGRWDGAVRKWACVRPPLAGLACIAACVRTDRAVFGKSCA